MSQAKRADWEQRNDESAPAYSAFKHYRDAGDSRSMVKTAKALGKAISLIERWAFQYAWQNRVRSHTRAMEAEATRHRAKRHQEMYKQQAGVASMLLAKAVERLKDMDPGELSVMEAVRFIKLGVDIEQQARSFNIHERVAGPVDIAKETAERIAAAKAGGDGVP